LFKPTKAAEYQFRSTAEEAMSYFVGGRAVDGGYAEDAGFAINGGKGWADCVYDNHHVELKSGLGVAMGNYEFTCATTGDKSKVEYTFGYMRCDDGKVRIFLHHSSVPYAATSGSKKMLKESVQAAPRSESKKMLTEYSPVDERLDDHFDILANAMGA
jgi:hypothetical protein